MGFTVLGGGDPAAEKRLAWALVLSLAIVIGGMAWTWRVCQDANLLYHKVSHAQDAVAGLRARLARWERKP